MAYTSIRCETHEDWLNQRLCGLGASEAATAIGLSPYMDNLTLWKTKTGMMPPKDITDNPNVSYGTDAEEPLRQLFALDYPELDVTYTPYVILKSVEYPFMLATLDGELYDRETQKHGILEIKTAEIRRDADWRKWDNKVPQHYYCQILHQLAVTGYDFVILKAQLKHLRKDEIRHDTRHYRFSADTDNIKSDIDYLITKEQEFWRCVEEHREPPQILPDI